LVGGPVSFRAPIASFPVSGSKPEPEANRKQTGSISEAQKAVFFEEN
jgi:hypothetical protein